MRNMRFERWFPSDRLFAADPALPGSSTIKAVRHAFELAAERVPSRCEHCDAIRPAEGALYYMV
jgi:hypothetical protein